MSQDNSPEAADTLPPPARLPYLNGGLTPELEAIIQETVADLVQGVEDRLTAKLEEGIKVMRDLAYRVSQEHQENLELAKKLRVLEASKTLARGGGDSD